MSNERIDLTQFDAITKGPWTITCSVFKGKYILNQAEENENLTVDEVCANADLMRAGPELVAELKRCYDLIDTFYPPPGLDVWGEDPDHPRHEWEEEVVATNVNAGYWHWVSNEKQRLASE